MQKGFSAIILMLTILLISSAIVGGSFYLKRMQLINTSHPTANTPQIPIAILSANPTIIPSSSSSLVLSVSPSPVPTASVDRNPPETELTFETAYSNGDFCMDAKNKLDCESRDMIKIQNNTIVSGKDGKVDCKWLPTQQICTSN